MLYVRAAVSASTEKSAIPQHDGMKRLKARKMKKLTWEDHQPMHDDPDGGVTKLAAEAWPIAFSGSWGRYSRDCAKQLYARHRESYHETKRLIY